MKLTSRRATRADRRPSIHRCLCPHCNRMNIISADAQGAGYATPLQKCAHYNRATWNADTESWYVTFRQEEHP